MEHNIGFIGLGAMGWPMAMNVRKHMPTNATLYIQDVYRPSCERFKTEYGAYGAIEIVDSAKAIAQNALTIVSIVPTGKNVADVYLNESTGILAAKGASPSDTSRLYFECSTIDIDTAKHVGTTLSTAGMGTYIDAPVSGGVPAANAATLSLLLGRAPPTSDTATSPLEKRIATLASYMGAAPKLFHCGGLGMGLAAKICNNYLSCTINLANCEAMAAGRKLGLDKHLLHKVISNSTGQNFMADHVAPVPGVVEAAPSSHDYRLGFKAQMLVKDVGLGCEVMRTVGVEPSIGDAAMRVYERVAKDERCIDKDASVVYRFLGGPED